MDYTVMCADPITTPDCFFQELNRFRMTGAFCDAVLATDDGATFRVHKIAMALCSSYFRTLFTTSLLDKSSGEGNKTYFHIPNVSSSVLEAIIKYAYCGIVDIDTENVNSLLPAADQFNVFGIVDECIKFILENMSVENCIGAWRFGIDYYMPKLEQEARRFFLANFVEVSLRSKEFLHLTLDNLRDILNDNTLNTISETFVWIAIKRWCQYNYEKRRHWFSCLFLSVRLALLPIADFQQIMNDPRVFTSIPCRHFINLVSKYFLNEIRDLSQISQDRNAIIQFTPRHPHEIILASGGWTFYGTTNTFEVYDCRANMWKVVILGDFHNRYNHQVVSLGKHIYVIGGCTSRNEILNSCWRIDASNRDCQEISPMQEQRCYHCVAILNDKVYVFGGFNGFNRLRTVEYYDHVQNQWTHVSPMNERRSDASAATLRNRIFVVGGYDGDIFLQSAECYYAEFDQWFFLTNMIKCRSGLGCVALDNSIYAIGGFDGIDRMSSVEKYSIEHKQWFTIKSMERQRSNFAVTVLENKIYVMGGHNGTADISLDQAECFDPIKYKWSTIAQLNIGRTGFSACTLSGIPNLKPYIRDDEIRCLLGRVSGTEMKYLNSNESLQARSLTAPGNEY